MSKYGYDVPIQHDEWEEEDGYFKEIDEIAGELLDGKDFSPGEYDEVTRVKIEQGKDQYGQKYVNVLQNASISCYLTAVTEKGEEGLLTDAIKSAKSKAEAYVKELSLLLEELKKQEKSC